MKERLNQQILTAAGGKRAQLVLKSAKVLNVFTEELEAVDVAISDGYIVGLGSYEGEQEVDLSGMVICPGFLDGHIHLESSMVAPQEFERAVLPHGTTGVITDPHEIANVAGTEGIDYMLETTRELNMDVYFMLPSCVPATGLDESGAVLLAEQLSSYYQRDRVLGLAELMNAYGTVHGDSDILDKICDAAGNHKIIDGHAPGISGQQLNAYVAAGVRSDHECSTAEEALEKLRRGQWIMIREGTAAKNLQALMPLCRAPYADRCMFVTDDKHPGDLLDAGHIDGIIRKAIALGADPITAIKMGSCHTARYFGLNECGAVAPGYRADLAVLSDLETVKVHQVYKEGKLVAQDGELIGKHGRQTGKCVERTGKCGQSDRTGVWGIADGDCEAWKTPEAAAGMVETAQEAEAVSQAEAALRQDLEKRYPRVYRSFQMRKVRESDFQMRAESPVKADCQTGADAQTKTNAQTKDHAQTRIRAICLTPQELLTTEREFAWTEQAGFAPGVDVSRDLIKMAVLERHHGTGHIGLGFLHGYGLRAGAVATSVAHDSHNLIVAGVNDADMTLAANTVRKYRGGLAVVRGGKVLGVLPLPIAGLMTPEPVAEVDRKLEELKRLTREMGIPDSIDPFMTLAFASLPVIPKLRLNTYGLIDVEKQSMVDAIYY